MATIMTGGYFFVISGYIPEYYGIIYEQWVNPMAYSKRNQDLEL